MNNDDGYKPNKTQRPMMRLNALKGNDRIGCVLASLKEHVSVRPSVRPSVMLCNAFVKNARKSFISPILSLPFNALGLFMPF